MILMEMGQMMNIEFNKFYIPIHFKPPHQYISCVNIINQWIHPLVQKANQAPQSNGIEVVRISLTNGFIHWILKSKYPPTTLLPLSKILLHKRLNYINILDYAKKIVVC